MLNLIQKLHALMVSAEIRIWHYAGKKDGPQFVYWLESQPNNKEGFPCNTFEELIDKAYTHIDPLNKPLPTTVEKPPQA